MIINEENKDSHMFKGTMLRGFNNTPSNIVYNLNKEKQILKRYEQNNSQEEKTTEEKIYNPEKQKEILTKLNRINK